MLKNYISSVEKMVKADGSPLLAKSRFRQMASVYIHIWTYTGLFIVIIFIYTSYFSYFFAFRQEKSKVSFFIPAGSDLWWGESL